MEMKNKDNDLNNDPTLNELKKIFNDHGLSFYIKKRKGSIAKVHIAIKEEE